MGSVQDSPIPIDLPNLSAFPAALRGKRILLCTESFGPVNGVSRTTLMLVNHLRANGAIVAVVAPHNHTQQNLFIPSSATDQKTITSSLSPSTSDMSSSQNTTLRLPGYPLPYNPELSIVYPFLLSSLYKATFHPDLIYLASPASLGFQVLLQLRQQPPQNQVPVICNFQTDLAGYCAILFSPPLSALAVHAFASVQSFLFRHASVRCIFYPSRFVRRYLEAKGVQCDKMEILQRGVESARVFHPGRRSEAARRRIAPGGEVVLICVARLAAEKGFGFLADVARQLEARGLRFKLWIVGGNRNGVVEGEIKDMFAGLVERGVVVFAGMLVGEELATAYASADVFLHCSVTETFGLVVLESMASGVPVVARDEGGPSDIVQHGQSGFLVPPEDLDGFVEKVVLLAGDERLRRGLGEAARRQAEGETWERINNKVAWRMVDVIQKRETAVRMMGDGNGGDGGVRRMAMATTPVFGWLLLSNAFRARVVDMRLAGGIAVISGFWIVVGLYLALIKLGLWFSTRVRS
ncbi:glycosyltransferase family 4 protein [Podospora appendiculata]|uniref:Glycosyltransferase family 4 protein n=1 Tax=Podospora appendiculata TaxID=314037 RepID=A0AAE1CCV4_9PEZI|nr:glycosyltransferase family 4 protein [Podospora appendiculata]